MESGATGATPACVPVPDAVCGSGSGSSSPKAVHPPSDVNVDDSTWIVEPFEAVKGLLQALHNIQQTTLGQMKGAVATSSEQFRMFGWVASKLPSLPLARFAMQYLKPTSEEHAELPRSEENEDSIEELNLEELELGAENAPSLRKIEQWIVNKLRSGEGQTEGRFQVLSVVVHRALQSIREVRNESPTGVLRKLIMYIRETASSKSFTVLDLVPAATLWQQGQHFPNRPSAVLLTYKEKEVHTAKMQQAHMHHRISLAGFEATVVVPDADCSIQYCLSDCEETPAAGDEHVITNGPYHVARAIQSGPRVPHSFPSSPAAMNHLKASFNMFTDDVLFRTRDELRSGSHLREPAVDSDSSDSEDEEVADAQRVVKRKFEERLIECRRECARYRSVEAGPSLPVTKGGLVNVGTLINCAQQAAHHSPVLAPRSYTGPTPPQLSLSPAAAPLMLTQEGELEALHRTTVTKPNALARLATLNAKATHTSVRLVCGNHAAIKVAGTRAGVTMGSLPIARHGLSVAAPACTYFEVTFSKLTRHKTAAQAEDDAIKASLRHRAALDSDSGGSDTDVGDSSLGADLGACVGVATGCGQLCEPVGFDSSSTGLTSFGTFHHNSQHKSSRCSRGFGLGDTVGVQCQWGVDAESPATHTLTLTFTVNGATVGKTSIAADASTEVFPALSMTKVGTRVMCRFNSLDLLYPPPSCATQFAVDSSQIEL